MRWTQKPPLGVRVNPCHRIGRALQSAWTLNAGAGTIFGDDGPNKYHGQLVGWTPPTNNPWTAGPDPWCGAGITGITTSRYGQIDPPRQWLATGVYPWWFGVVASHTGTTEGTAISQASTASNNPIIALRYNQDGVANRLGFYVRDDSPVVANPNATHTACSDGLRHFVVGYAFAPNIYFLYVDGVPINGGQSLNTIGAITTNTLSLGVLRRSTVSLPFTNGTIHWAGGGVGWVPDPMLAYRELWSAYGEPLSRRVIFDLAAGRVRIGRESPLIGQSSPLIRRAS